MIKSESVVHVQNRKMLSKVACDYFSGPEAYIGFIRNMSEEEGCCDDSLT